MEKTVRMQIPLYGFGDRTLLSRAVLGFCWKDSLMKYLLVACLFAASASAAWETTDIDGNSVGFQNCQSNNCFMKDTATGLVWSYTIGKGDILAPVNYTQAEADQACRNTGLRLPTPAEFSGAINNGMAGVNRRFPAFGDPRWFFWTDTNGVSMSLEAPNVNPWKLAQRAKFKCVGPRGGAVPPPGPVGPPNINDPTQQLAATQNTLEAVATQFEQQASVMTPQEQAQLDLPEFVINEAARTITLKEPLAPVSQRQLWSHERKTPSQGVVQAGQNGTSGPPGNPWTPNYRTTSQRWGIGGEYFALLAFYEIGADRSGNGLVFGALSGSVLKKSYELLALTARTVRGQNDITATGVARVYNRNVAQVGARIEINQVGNPQPGKSLHKQVTRLAQMRFTIGPIPMSVEAGLNAEYGYQPWEFSSEFENQNELAFAAELIPYAKAAAYAQGGPDAVIAKAGVRTKLNFVEGSVKNRFESTTSSDPCFQVGLQGFRSLNGAVALFAEFEQPVFVIVEKVIGGFCRNLGWFKKLCEPVQRFMTRVKKLQTFAYEQNIFKWRGVDLGRYHSWANSCPR